MLVCTQCAQENSADSKFCKSCGLPFDAVARDAAEAEVDKLVAEGRRLVAEQRLDEALMVAEAAIHNSPSSPLALSLAGDCLEQLGRYDEALAHYERLLELQPDSTLDRIKVAHLRKRLLERMAVAPRNKGRRSAMLAGAAALLVFACIGSAVVVSMNRNGQPVASLAQNESGGLRLEGFSPSTTPNLGAANQNGATQQPSTANPIPPANVNTNQPATGAGRGMALPPLTGGRPGQLPNATNNGTTENTGGSEDTGFGPLQPNVNIVPETAANSSGNSPGTDEDPSTAGSQNQEPPVLTKPDRPSVVEITPSQGDNRNVGGSESIGDSSTKVETLLRVARQHFQTGNFSSAADAYDKALRGGADPGSTNQRLAQCYDRLGKKSEAVGAYQRAISAFRSSLKSGGNESRLNASIESCERAISVLGG